MSATVSLRNALEAHVLSLVRIMVGLLFLEHGMSKLLGFPPGPSPSMFALSWFAGVIELVGGALVVLGLFTRVAAFIMSGEMAIGYFLSHAPRGFFPMLNLGELAVVYCFTFLYLFVAGGGEWSLDRMRASRA